MSDYIPKAPKLLFSFPQGEDVLDMHVIKKRKHWYSLKKTETLYIATNSGVYTIS